MAEGQEFEGVQVAKSLGTTELTHLSETEAGKAYT